MKKLTRIICLLLALAVLLPALQTLSPEVSAYAAAKPLPELTGNKGQDVANIAKSQLGYSEASDGGTVYGAWWTTASGSSTNFTRLGWCAMFAMWCANQAGAGRDVAYNGSGAQPHRLMEYQFANGTGDKSFTMTPKPGDFVFFSTGSSAQHVAIVVDYNSSTNKLTFVGGNQGNKVTQFTMLYTSSAKFGSQRIIGISRPNYSGETVTPTPTPDPTPVCTCSDGYAGYYQCITQTDPLNIRSGHGSGYSVVGSIPPGAMVYISKAQGIGDDHWAHVEYNNIKGYASMKYLKRVSEYSMDVTYDERTGDVIGANVEIFDFVTTDEMTLALPEQLDVTENGVSPVIHVKAKDGFLLNLEIPLSTDHSNVIPTELLADGTSLPLGEYGLTDSGICVTTVGTMDVQLVYAAPEHTHSYTHAVTTQPTCEATGVRTYSCACGNTYTEAIPALGHSYSETVTAPTCESQGYTTYTCTRCDKTYQANTVPATGHDYTVSTTQPTCEKGGVRTYTCDCGSSYTEDIAPLGHSYTEAVTAPTCTAQGYTTYICAHCGHTYQDNYTDATGHSYTTEVTAPTCEDQGYTTYVCSCGDSYAADYLPAAGHKFIQGKCDACGEADPDCVTPVAPSGLQKGEDGNFYYYVNGTVATDFTGLVKNSVGSWYIKDGMAQISFDGLVTVEGTKYLIKAGRVSGYTGIAKQEGVYYYFTSGVNDLQFEGLVLCNGMKAYVQDGEVNFNKTALVDDNGTLSYVKYGIWRNTFKGLVRDDNGQWRYLTGGTFDSSYTGVAKLNTYWVYVNQGIVDFTYTGTVMVSGITYRVQYGYIQL